MNFPLSPILSIPLAGMIFLLASCEQPGSSSGKSVLQRDSNSEPSSRKAQEIETSSKVDRKADVVVDSAGTDQVVVAQNNDVIIKGEGGGVIMVSGRCRNLLIHSGNTEVYCEKADQIEIHGDSNSVVLGSVAKGTVSGNRNKVIWESTPGGESPVLTASGQDNEVRKIEAADQRF